MRLILLFLPIILLVCADNGYFNTECDISLNRCFKYISSPATYTKAEETCTSEGGHLVSIGNGFVGASIGESAIHAFSSSDFWIGANFIFQNEWSWTDGTAFSYTNWAAGQPSNNQAAAMKLGINSWVNYNPNELKPFVCELSIQLTSTPSSPRNCPKVYGCKSGWTYFEHTKSCYKTFFGGEFSYAETICQEHGGHLTSIHNDEENTFVSEIASSGYPEKVGANQTWIGMYRERIWTDGTKMDYLAWGYRMHGPLQGDSYNCVLLASEGYTGNNDWYRKWNNWPCETSMRNFVCKMPTV